MLYSKPLILVIAELFKVKFSKLIVFPANVWSPLPVIDAILNEGIVFKDIQLVNMLLILVTEAVLNSGT